jgi:hypothetical protein
MIALPRLARPIAFATNVYKMEYCLQLAGFLPTIHLPVIVQILTATTYFDIQRT